MRITYYRGWYFIITDSVYTTTNDGHTILLASTTLFYSLVDQHELEEIHL